MSGWLSIDLTDCRRGSLSLGCPASAGLAMSHSPKPSIKRRLFKWLGWSVFAVLLLFGGSNLWLASPWAAEMVEVKLEQRTGVKWEVGGMSWSPWNGVTVRGLAVAQPELLEASVGAAMLTVDRVRVLPYWRPLWRGRFHVRELVVDSPRGVVAVEMLATLTADAIRGREVSPMVQGEVPPADPVGADAPEEAGIKKGVEQSAQAEGPRTSDSSQHSNGASKAGGGPNESAKKRVAAVPVPAQRAPLGLPARVSVLDAHLSVVSARTQTELFRIERAALDIELLGEDAPGLLEVEKLKIAGGLELNHLSQMVEWKRPYLQWRSKPVNVGGVDVGYNALLGLAGPLVSGKGLIRGRSGRLGQMPFRVEVVAVPQKVDSFEWLNRVALDVSAEKFSGRFRCSGVVQHPSSWRGDLQVLGRKIRMKEKHGGRDVEFDELIIPAVFSQGELHWGGLRLIGEDLSVLGNGKISAKSGVLSVTRLVVSPEVGEMVSRGLYGAELAPNGPLWWSDLNTPDRKMRDFLVSGTLIDPVIDIGRQHQDVSVREILETTLKFVRQEMKEEGRDLKPIPMELLKPSL